MRKYAKWPGWLVLGVCLGVSAWAGCDDDPSGAAQLQVDKIEITPASLVGIEVDTTIQLQARVLDAAGQVMNVGVTWATDNPAVATVSNTGLLQTHDNGAVRITATAGLQTAQLQLNVEHHAAVVQFVASAPPMRVTNQYRLQIKILDPHGTELQRAMQWASQHPDIVTVDQNGNLTALKAGTAIITVSGDGVTANMQVTVMATVMAINIEPGPQTLRIGQQLQLTARVRDGEGNVLTDRPVQWSSSNPGFATVDGNGLVTALAAGNVIITALSEQVVATVTLVIASPVATVSVLPAQVTILMGGTATLQAVGRDAQGAEVAVSGVAWTSSNTGIATVDASGVVTAVGAGIASITAMVDNVSGTAQVIVPAQVTSLVITPQVADLEIDGEVMFIATLLNASGVVVNAPINWTSSATGIATVSRSGVVKGITEGTVTITATAGGVSASVVVNVGPPVALITFAQHPPINLVVGESYQLQPTVKDAAGNVLVNRILKYTSADVNVATVSSSGLVTATGSGTVDITAASGQVNGTVSVRVHPRVHGVQVTPGQGTLQPGQSQQLTAVLKDAGGNDVPGRTAIWTSSDTSVAKVDANGVVTAVAAGSATITATIDGASAVAVITVVVGLARIEIIDPRAEPDQPVMVGGTLQFTAKAYDAANVEIPGITFNWTSSSPSIASVDGTGLVTGIARGTTVITATAGTLSDNVDVRVAGSGQGGGGGGGGEDDGYGANLSVPVIFTEGFGLTGLPVATDPGMRPLSTEAAAGLAPVDGVGTFFYSGNAPDCPQGASPQYYCQRSANTWRAEWRNGSAAPINATASWGDNLTHQTWRTSVPIRVEVVLTDPATTLQGFNMPYVSGQGMSEVQGTDGTTAAMIPTLYTRTPRLIIEKLTGEGGTVVQRIVDKAHYASVDGPGNLAAEVTVSGRVVYGFQLKVSDYSLPAGVPTDGWYRLTFRVDNVAEGAPVDPNLSITAIGNTADGDEELAYVPQLGTDGRSTYIEIYVTSGSGGSGGSGGGQGGKPTASISVTPASNDIAVGGTVQLTGTVKDEDGTVVPDRHITWTSSDPTIATVDSTGKVTGIKDGNVVITAESEGKTGQADIKVGAGGSGGGGGPGGGGDEGLGNNLSWPVTFAEGIGLTGLPVTQDPGLRPTAEENVVVSSLPFFYSNNASDCQITTASVVLLYCQQSQNVWQAQWLDASAQGVRNAMVQWGDNLTHHTWNSHSPIRIEVVLNDLSSGPMQGYNMFYVSGQGPDELQGTDGTVADFVPTIYSVTPRLIAERIDTVDGNPVAGTRAVNVAVWQSLNVDGPGGFGAEVNVGGKVIYGFNFSIQSVDNTGWPVHKYGWWRLTFKLDDRAAGAPVDPNVLLSALASLEVTDEDGGTLTYTPKLATDGKSSWIDIYIQSASGGGGGGGGGGHSGGGGTHVPSRAELIAQYTADLPSSLHGTAKGMDYWYSVPTGYGSQINVSYQTLNTCKGCHVYNSTLTQVPASQPCLACHAPSAADASLPDYDVVDNTKCMNCHGRQSAEIAMGMTDVHRSAGMGCSDCHQAADVHGGVTANSMLETITTSCSDCHKSGGASPAVSMPMTQSHTQHGSNIACQTCHMSGTLACYNCHLNDELTKSARVAFKRIGNWTFLGNWKNKIYPLTFTSVEYLGETFNAWGPFTGHNIQQTGKTCAECHDNQYLKTYDAQGELRLTTWDESTKTLANLGGVIPVTPDYATAFKFDYITKNPAGAWTFVETGPDRSQMLYSTPLTTAQLDRLRTPQ